MRSDKYKSLTKRQTPASLMQQFLSWVESTNLFPYITA